MHFGKPCPNSYTINLIPYTPKRGGSHLLLLIVWLDKNGEEASVENTTEERWVQDITWTHRDTRVGREIMGIKILVEYSCMEENPD